MKRRSGASVPGIASRWGCRWGGACRCGGSSAALGAWRRVRSGRASPACHENKETKRGLRPHFFSRPRKREVGERRGLRPAPRALPRVGRMPPPGPPGLRPLCAVRHTGTCYLSPKGRGVISFANVDCDYVIDFLWFAFCILFLITCCNLLHIKCSIF